MKFTILAVIELRNTPFFTGWSPYERMMFFKSTFLVIAGLLVLSASSAQTTDRLVPAAMEEPAWVRMMDDPNVNYFEALKVYDAYWKSHPKPLSEAEIFGTGGGKEKQREGGSRETDADLETRKKQLAAQPTEVNEYLKYQSKRFEGWARDAKPWVQENGHILSYEERMEIWKKQQEELRKQEIKK